MKLAHALQTLIAVSANGFEPSFPSINEQIISCISYGSCLLLLLLGRLINLGLTIWELLFFKEGNLIRFLKSMF
jgi:hypothetical protein